MSTALSVDILKPAALSPAERAAWDSFTAASPCFQSPFFSLKYAQAADGIAPGAAVAVIHQGGDIAGFLPFQKRGGAAQPLAAPMTDYHGLISAPGTKVDLDAVVRLMGVSGYQFSGLVAEAAPESVHCVAHAPVAADVSGGPDAYMAGRPAAARKFLKDKERAARAAERDLGPLEFTYEDSGPGLLDFVLHHKRQQFRRTARHDIFACGWTEALLRRLWEERTGSFGGRIATLRAGGRLVAAEFSLRAGPVRHLWFHAFDPAVGQYGPGALLLIRLMKAAAEDPSIASIDFGREGESYKRHYADPCGTVYEGGVEVEAWRRASARVADAALSATPMLKPLVQVRERLRRRFAIIDACEVTAAGRFNGAAEAFRGASRRGPALAQT